MNLYIALTPFHILMTLLHRDRKHGDKILVVDQTGNFSSNYNNLTNSSCFDLNWAFFDESKMSMVEKALAFNRFGLEKFYAPLDTLIGNYVDENIKKVFVFNDTPISVQNIIFKIGVEDVTYIEDGTAPYNSHYIFNSVLQKIVKKIAFGNYYDWKPILGTSKFIKNGVFTYPQYIRKENMIYPIKKFELRNDYLEIIKEFTNKLGFIENITSNKRSIVFFMPKVNKQQKVNRILHSLNKVVNFFINSDWTVFIKSHPLSKCNEFFDSHETIEIESTLPAEIIPSKIQNINVIVGMETTSLASIAFLYPSMRGNIYSIVDDVKGDANLHQYFKNIGINLIYSPSVLLDKMKNKTI
jgi:hypothetical protein